MKELPDDLLLSAYMRAVELQLEEDFLTILRDELRDRNIDVQYLFNAAASDDY